MRVQIISTITLIHPLCPSAISDQTTDLVVCFKPIWELKKWIYLTSISFHLSHLCILLWTVCGERPLADTWNVPRTKKYALLTCFWHMHSLGQFGCLFGDFSHEKWDSVILVTDHVFEISIWMLEFWTITSWKVKFEL